MKVIKKSNILNKIKIDDVLMKYSFHKERRKKINDSAHYIYIIKKKNPLLCIIFF
jgi:hypothetical protein